MGFVMPPCATEYNLLPEATGSAYGKDTRRENRNTRCRRSNRPGKLSGPRTVVCENSGETPKGAPKG